MISVAELPLASLPSKYAVGWGSPEDTAKVSKARTQPFQEALERHYVSDEHFVSYVVVDAEGDPVLEMPRLAKSAVPYIENEGDRIVCTLLAFDWDTPGHLKWRRANFDRFFDLFHAAQERSPIIREWAAWYTTTKGARLIYRLSEPVGVEQAEQHLLGMFDHFEECGLKVDRSAKDWTRLMRMPAVNREKHGNTWEDPFYVLQVRDGHFVDPVNLPRDTNHTSSIPVVSDELDVPESGACHKLLKSEWVGQAHSALKGTPAYDVIVSKEPIEGGNPEVFSLAGHAVAAAFRNGLSIEHAYALLLPAVEQLQYDDGYEGETWEECLWRAIRNAWYAEVARAEETAEFLRLQKEQTGDIWDGIIAGAREWCPAAELHGSRDDAIEFLTPRLILVDGNAYYLMKPNGYFEEPVTNTRTIIPTLRMHGMDAVIDLYYTTSKGTRDVTLETILRNHCVAVGESRAVYGSAKGATVEGYHKPRPTAIARSMFSLNPAISGVYHPQVAQWLSFLTGTEEEEAALHQWLAHALDFNRGIPMLALIGPPAIGKQLLVRGLSENLSRPEFADFDSVIGSYQWGLLRSPFIVVNEGFPIQPGQGKRMADQVRGLVSGDPTPVNVKYMPQTSVSAFYRIVMTANNDTGLMNLYSSQILQEHDRAAIAERTVYLRGSTNAATYLARLGGMRHTARKGARWVASPGQPSDYIVARHLRWLYENRTPADDSSRFCVPGFMPPGLISSMATQSESSYTVVECLMGLLQESNPDGVVWEPETGVPMVTSKAVLDYWRAQTELPTPTREQVGRALSGLSQGTVRHRTGSGVRKRLHRLDVDLLLHEAEASGLTIPKALEEKT